MNYKNEKQTLTVRHKNTNDANSDNIPTNSHCDAKIQVSETTIKVESQNDVYLNLSNSLSYFNDKINKMLAAIKNIDDTQKENIDIKKHIFEIRQNQSGDDVFYIDNILVNESDFIAKLLSYKK